MAETIQDWIISLKYQVDEQSARRVEDIARRLRAGQQVTSQEMREFEKGMKGLARTHESSMRQMSQNTQQHGQRFSAVVNQVIHPSIVKITAALGALSTAVGGFKAFEGVVKNLQQVGDLSRDLNVTALSLNALDRALKNIGAGSGAATSLVTTMQDAVQRNRGNIVLLQGMGVTARDSAERVIELSRFVKREAAANRFDIAVQRIAEIGYSVADARRMLALSEGDYRRQQAIRQRWKLDSADDIKTAQKLRSEWEDVMTNMEGVQNAIFVPMMNSITKIIGEVNKAVAGHEGEIRAFFTAITEPIGQWAEEKAADMIGYMNKLIGPEGAQERAAWITWWNESKNSISGVAADLGAIVHGLAEIFRYINLVKDIDPVAHAATAARQTARNAASAATGGAIAPSKYKSAAEEIQFDKYAQIDENEMARRRGAAGLRQEKGTWETITDALRRDEFPGKEKTWWGRFTDKYRRDVPPADATAPTAPIGGTQQQIQRQQDEEIRVTKDNTEEVKKNTQELQEQRRSSRGFFGTAWDQIKNLVGAGGTQGAGEGGPPDISGRGAGGGGGGSGGTAGDSGGARGARIGERGPGAVGGRIDRGGFETNPAQVRAGGGKASPSSAVNTSLSPEARALLDTIAGTESPGYNVMYRGGRFGSYADHPRQNIPILTGPNAGKTSSAAGRYQFLARTWDRAAKALGLKDFSPANQDRAALWLAQQRYGPNLERDLKDPSKAGAIGRALRGEWTSLPGGIEATTSESAFGSRFNANLSKYRSQGSPNPAEVRGAVRDQQHQQASQLGGVTPNYEGQRSPGFGKDYDPRQGVNPALLKVIDRAREISGIPFSLYEGGRNEERQRENVRKGWSKTMNSLHLQGRAVDLRAPGDPAEFAASPEAKARYARINAAMQQASKELGTPVEWGGNWKGFQDLPHFQLPRGYLGGDGQTSPIATPANVANDNSRSVTQHNEYKTNINAEDARGAASIFKGAAENINRLNMSQIKGVIR